MLVLWLTGLLSAFGILSAGPAAAHAVLLRTSPPAGYSVPGPVEVLSLTFTESVTARANSVRVIGPTPGLRPLARATDGGRTLIVATGPLRDGVYEVAWQVTGSDGDVVTGRYRFAVGTGTDPSSLQFSSRPDAVTGSFDITVLLRAFLFLSLAVLLGGLTGSWLVRKVRVMAATGRALPEPWLMPLPLSCVVGATAAVMLAAHVSDGTSILSGLLGLRPWQVQSGAAAVPMTEAWLFAAAGLLSLRPGRLQVLAVGPALGIAFAEGFRGHLHQQDGVAGAVLVGVHLAVAAAWTGALFVVLRTAARWRTAGRSNAAWLLVHDYARAALVAYFVVIGTGTVAGVLLLPSWQSLAGTRYGVTLLTKLALVAIATVLALRSRRLLRHTESSADGLRLGLLEPGTLSVVLVAAAVLVSFVPPRVLARANAPISAPPPTGPVVQLGTLAGQLTVGVTVATGQVRVQLSSPASDDGRAHEKFDVTAGLRPRNTRRRGAPELLKFERCDPGCFVAPANVEAPGIELALVARVNDWRGGAVTFDVPWPPTPATLLLQHAIALFRAAPVVELRESVTSDTSRPTPSVTVIRDSGPEFLATESYGDARSIQAVQLTSRGGLRRLAFAVGDSIFVEFTLDASGRPVAEQLVTPNHLIRRQLSYPVRR